MGNKAQTPESWVKDLYDEKREEIWGTTKLEKMPYPAFWPKAHGDPNEKMLSQLVFGAVFQFPNMFIVQLLGPLATLRAFPAIDYGKINAPSDKMMEVFEKIAPFDAFWKESVQKKDIYYVIRPLFEILKEYEAAITDYLETNVNAQLNYFGIIDGNSNAYQPWFDKKLPYIPDNYRLGVILFLLLQLESHFENDNAPFIQWKSRSTPQLITNEIPDLPEFKKQIPLLRATHGNFWTTMNDSLHNEEQVIDFWTRNKELLIPVANFRSALKAGQITFGADGHVTDLHTDTYEVRMNFFNLFKLKMDGKPFFNFPYWSDMISDRFTKSSLLNRFIRNYLFLMVTDIEELVPDIWERTTKILYPTLPWETIRPAPRTTADWGWPPRLE